MAFQFPASPAVNQTFTPVAGTTYRWSGTAWFLLAGPGAFITQAEGDLRYLQQAGADALYVNVNEVPNISNRIINGKMAIDQRNAGAVKLVNTSNVATLDRWTGWAAGGGAFQAIKSLNLPRKNENALTLTVSTTTATPAAGDFYVIGQTIEGIYIADFNLGSADAKAFTVAFEARSSVAGTFPISFRSSNADRSYVATYALLANAWTTVALTIPPETTGTWAADNFLGASMYIALGAGATLQSPVANAWQNGSFFTVAGCTNLMATASATFALANVRLYKGSVDFGPDRRLYAEELALCQRYYQKSYPINTVPGTAGFPGMVGASAYSTTANRNFIPIRLAPLMRTVPTITLYNAESGATGSWSLDGTAATVAAQSPGEASFSVTNSAATGAAVPLNFYGHWTASAEL